jgi:glucose/arabinose dehydrogenase
VPPSGASIFRGDKIPAFKGDLLVTTLRSEHLHRVIFDKAPPHRIIGHEVYFRKTYGRLRGGLTGPDGAFYVLTGNCDSITTCPVPDRLLRVHAP